MKKILYVVVVALAASACSTPKYTASFNSYDKHARTQSSNQPEAMVITPAVVTQPQQLLASTSNAPVEIKNAPKAEVRKTYIQMSKTERKALRAHLRSEIKSYVKEQKKSLSVESTQAGMDNDLKLAAIFGAVGLVAMFIGGDVFWVIGGIALIIGVVFLVKWLVRQ